MDERREFVSDRAPAAVLTDFKAYAAKQGWTVDGLVDGPRTVAAVEGFTLETWSKRIELRASVIEAGGSAIHLVVSTDQPITWGALRRTADAVVAALGRSNEAAH